MSVGTAPIQSALRPVTERSRSRRPKRLESHISRVGFTLGASICVGVGAGFGIRIGVGVLLAVVVVLIALLRPVFSALALVAIVPVTSGLRQGLPVPHLRPSEVLIGGVAGLLILAAPRGESPRWRAFDWLAFAYVIATAGLGSLDLLVRGSPITLADVSRLLGPAQFFLLYRALVITLKTAELRRRALRLLLLASIPVVILAVLQEAHVPGISNVLASITDSTAFTTESGVRRATGPFAIWHDLGSYLFIITLLGVSLLVAGAERVIRPRLLIPIVVFAGVGLMTTVTATPLTGTVIGLLILAGSARSFGRSWGMVAVVVILALIFAPLLVTRYHEQVTTQQAPVTSTPYLPENLSFRIQVWTTEFLPIVGKHLTTGFGPTPPSNLAFSSTESVYITLLLRGGLPLLFIYAGLMWTLAMDARPYWHAADPEQRAVGRVLLVVIALIIFMQMTTNYFVNAGFPYVFWPLAALLLAGAGRHRLPRGSPAQ